MNSLTSSQERGFGPYSTKIQVQSIKRKTTKLLLRSKESSSSLQNPISNPNQQKRKIFYTKRDKKKTANLIEKGFLFLIIDAWLGPMLEQMTLSHLQKHLRQFNLSLTVQSQSKPVQNCNFLSSYPVVQNTNQNCAQLYACVPVRRTEGADFAGD